MIVLLHQAKDLPTNEVGAAKEFAHRILARQLRKLPQETRLLFLLIEKAAEEDCKITRMKFSDYCFTKEQIGRNIGWSDRSIAKHLKILSQLGYIGEQSSVYRILKSSRRICQVKRL